MASKAKSRSSSVRGGAAAKVITTQLTRQQATRVAKSLASDAEFDDWLRNSPSMESLRHVAETIGECAGDLAIAVQCRDWALVTESSDRLQRHARSLRIMADAKKP